MICGAHAVVAAAALALVAGCATEKMYAGKQPVNLVVKTTLDAGSAWTSSAVALDIHGVESRCKTQYEGRIWLDAPEVRLGLAQEQPLLLSFAFASKEFLSGRGGSVRHETLFVARQGYTYVAEVSYVRGLYDVILKETRSGNGSGRVLERRSLPPC